MTESPLFCERCEDLVNPMTRELGEILRNSKSVKGPTTKFILNTTKLTDGELFRKERIGEKNYEKPHKVLLMVGETGTGKTTLINAMINYIMGVRWEHKMWLEVAEVHDERSLTTAVTVYEVYAQDSPFSLTIIDTPGFGDTESHDKRTAEALQKLFRSEDGIHEIHAVCLMLKASDTRLHERHQHILDKILSLFGKDVEKHIMVLITNSLSQKTVPKRSLNFIKAAKIPCAKMENGLPVYFKFDNCQSESFNEEDRNIYKSSWDNGIESFEEFFAYLKGLNPKSLNMTEGVLRARKQLDTNVSNLKKIIKLAALKKQELEQTKKALDKLEEYRRTMNNFQYEVDQSSLEKVPIESQWWHLSKQAICCTVCQENCHYPGSWWVTNLLWICIWICSVMSKQGTCTVCRGRCHFNKHVKDNKIYKIVHRKVTRTEEDMKNKYEQEYGMNKSLMTKLEYEIQQMEAEKVRLVEESYQCFEKIMEMALKSTSMTSFQHLDFMIERVKETGKQEKALKLENLKKIA